LALDVMITAGPLEALFLLAGGLSGGPTAA
jgi:hypothetical protein